MENRRNHHNGSGGFLLGVIVGVLITLLFTTKKGREILKELTEKGLDKFSDLEKHLQREDDEFDTFVEEEENDYIKPDQPTRHVAAAHATPEPAKKEPVHHVEHKKESPVVKPAEPKEAPRTHVAPEPKKAEPTPEPQHESSPEKEAPKKSGVRRFFRLKK